jgi:hypothetical protein
MSNLRAIMLMVPLAAATAACDNPTPEPAPPAPTTSSAPEGSGSSADSGVVPSFVGGDMIPEAPCTGTPGPPVTMRLGRLLANFGNGIIGRDIKRKLQGGATQDVERPNVAGNRWLTNIDMELAERAANGRYEPNDYVLVTVYLPTTARGIKFLRSKTATNANDPTDAIRVEPNKGTLFCGRTDIKPESAPAGESVTFGMLKGADTVSVNIGIMIPDTSTPPVYWLPIILDPNVKNSG